MLSHNVSTASVPLGICNADTDRGILPGRHNSVTWTNWTSWNQGFYSTRTRSQAGQNREGDGTVLLHREETSWRFCKRDTQRHLSTCVPHNHLLPCSTCRTLHIRLPPACAWERGRRALHSSYTSALRMHTPLMRHEYFQDTCHCLARHLQTTHRHPAAIQPLSQTADGRSTPRADDEPAWRLTRRSVRSDFSHRSSRLDALVAMGQPAEGVLLFSQ